jgi:murein DD-endopeptidase MepM/ murein hydrolase activator NlpD
MFGDAWVWAQNSEPLFPAGIRQPELILPFEPGRMWSYSSGPHKAWETEGALAALDFAPASIAGGCISSDAWVVAVADGMVVRSAYGAVVQDLDDKSSGQSIPSDGLEQTGWAILYMHIESLGRAPAGARLRAGDPLGHPSCEGGPTTGTHLHIARKYNGEWIAADGPLPFTLSGWVAHAGRLPYQGRLTRDGQTINARPNGASETLISRKDEDQLYLPMSVFTGPDQDDR